MGNLTHNKHITISVKITGNLTQNRHITISVKITGNLTQNRHITISMKIMGNLTHNKHIIISVKIKRNVTHRSLYEHGALVTHLPHDCQGVHRLVCFYQVHGCFHGDQHSRTSNARAENTHTSIWSLPCAVPEMEEKCYRTFPTRRVGDWTACKTFHSSPWPVLVITCSDWPVQVFQSYGRNLPLSRSVRWDWTLPFIMHKRLDWLPGEQMPEHISDLCPLQSSVLHCGFEGCYC